MGDRHKLIMIDGDGNTLVLDFDKDEQHMDVLITPEMAQTMLDTMGKNRKKHEPDIGKMSNDIKNGDMTVCTVPIAFSKAGRLIDGQHRLTAIIKTGIPARFSIRTGLDDDTVFDRGHARTTKDELYCRSMVDDDMATKQVISLVNAFLGAMFGSYQSLSFSDDQKAEFINTYKNDIQTAIRLTNYGPAPHPCYRGGIQAAVLGALLSGVDERTLLNFCLVANCGIAEARNQRAAVVLWKYISVPRINGRAAKDEMCAVAEMAIHDFVEGKDRQRAYTNPSHVYIDKLNISI